MTKVLKPYTIIPPDLYVQRDADRQIKYIINDMGRPGYVLVSRQMGKTNLLINAKRRLETPDDIFVFIDLSNPHDNARSCFENIIDTAIETHKDQLEKVGNIICERRKELLDTPPHKQHTNELRLLLNSINGKMVIILDEIDALTKTKYSDQIFAQIRSIYFSRVNFKELERLTYVLSGVIEPNEIIKDPKISPFNIGQKIFLNDFNREEFEQFINNSKLDIERDIRDRIYYWTNGNPRITWDICSEIENQIKILKITINVIDKIVSDLYLTAFNKPPIDNIREIVKNDREIRDAIVEIEYKKGKEVPDRIKSKLYLSGIINYDEDDVHLKNQIIKQCLNMDWIKKIEEDEKGLIGVALTNIEKENYTEALKYFERYLESNTFDDSSQALYYYYMGHAALKVLDYNKSIQFLNKSVFDIEDDRKKYISVLNLKSLAYFYSDQIEEALGCVKKIIDNTNAAKKDEEYVRAIINYGSFALKSKQSKHKKEAIEIYQNIIEGNNIDIGKLNGAFLNEVKSIAHHNLATLQEENADYLNAIINFNKAIEYGRIEIKPTILLSLFNLENDPNKKYIIINQFIDLLKDGLKPKKYDPEKPLDFDVYDLKKIFSIVVISYREQLFDKIKPFFLLLGERSLNRHLYDLALFLIQSDKDLKSAEKILNIVCDNIKKDQSEDENNILYDTIKTLAYIIPVNQAFNKYVEYVSLLKSNKITHLDEVDLSIFMNLVIALIEKKKYDDAKNYILLLKPYKELFSDEALIYYLVILHYEAGIYTILKKYDHAKEIAENILQIAITEQVKQQKTKLLGEEGLDVIINNAKSILYPAVKIKQLISEVQYGRNDYVKVRYKDGTIMKTKYKKVKDDIEKNNCFILN
jgi:hypothetical protein